MLVPVGFKLVGRRPLLLVPAAPASARGRFAEDLSPWASAPRGLAPTEPGPRPESMRFGPGQGRHFSDFEFNFAGGSDVEMVTT